MPFSRVTAQEVEEYLRNKYTNEELYSWMEGQIRTLNYQAYTLAYDLAKKVEKTYRFERGLTTSNFIQFGYWEAAHDGLLAGERLYISLKQLEAVYLEKRGYDYEIDQRPLQMVRQQRQVDALRGHREAGQVPRASGSQPPQQFLERLMAAQRKQQISNGRMGQGFSATIFSTMPVVE